MKNIDIFLENQSLKAEFAARGLDLSQIFYPDPEDPERENRMLHDFLDWVHKYNECGGNRKQMEADGFHFPPIDPGFSPDNDWYLFHRWMQGKPVIQTILEQLPASFKPKPAESLNDMEIIVELQNLVELLEKIHFTVDLNNDIPPRLIYEHLLEMLDEEFELMIEGFCHLDGCTGYCPDCFQRPWCEAGNEICWPEDEEAGTMYLIDAVKKYVSASPGSLEILRAHQAQKDGEFEEFKKKWSGIDPMPFNFHGDDDDDLPF